MFITDALLQDFDPGAGETAEAHRADHHDTDWMPIQVPGDVHRTLVAAGRIPDPFFDLNEDAVAWVADREWWYRLTLPQLAKPIDPSARVSLTFHGLDTLATVWLNGELLGEHRNMHRPAVFDVTEHLRADGPHLVAVRFESVTAGRVADGESLADLTVRDRLRFPLRKNQVDFGWDVAPVLLTVGMWQPVELRHEQGAVVRSVHFNTVDLDPDHGSALVTAEAEIETIASIDQITAQVTLHSPSGEVVGTRSTTLAGGTGPAYSTKVSFQVDGPQLWWTHDLGPAPLYTLTVSLSENGRELDTYLTKVGIRTLELDQSPDQTEPGTRFFRFILNGVAIFARGANTVPVDMAVGAIEPQAYDLLISRARDANMTMLRVWGGGIYNHDRFYDGCDARGVLVWQDFMFSGEYDGQPASLFAEVSEEARFQVRRLRNHPCIAIWCGNNESQYQHGSGSPTPGKFVLGLDVFADALPNAVADLSPRTPYWPGSPYAGNNFNSREDGDAHDWRGWHGDYSYQRFGEDPQMNRTGAGRHWHNYGEAVGRFVSEFGFVGAPNIETLRKWLPAAELHAYSAGVAHRNKDIPVDKGNQLMELVTGIPTTLEDFVDFSMMIQASGVKFGIESFRRRKPHCSGALLWQLNDCWPGHSWSLIDYEGFLKASYFSTRRAFAPVLASFRPMPDGGLELWVTNDTLSPLNDLASIVLQKFDGRIESKESIAVLVPANESRPVRAWGPAEILDGPDRFLSVRSEGDLFGTNRHFFTEFKDHQRTTIPPVMSIEPVHDHEVRVNITAMTFASFVHLEASDPQIHYSDNYVDLDAGESCTLVLNSAGRSIDPATIRMHSR